MDHKLIYCEMSQSQTSQTSQSVIPKPVLFWGVDVSIFRVLLTWQEIFFLLLFMPYFH